MATSARFGDCISPLVRTPPRGCLFLVPISRSRQTDRTSRPFEIKWYGEDAGEGCTIPDHSTSARPADSGWLREAGLDMFGPVRMFFCSWTPSVVHTVVIALRLFTGPIVSEHSHSSAHPKLGNARQQAPGSPLVMPAVLLFIIVVPTRSKLFPGYPRKTSFVSERQHYLKRGYANVDLIPKHLLAPSERISVES